MCKRVICINSATPRVLSISSHDDHIELNDPNIITILNMTDIIPALPLGVTDYDGKCVSYYYKPVLNNLILLNYVRPNFTLRDCHSTESYAYALKQINRLYLISKRKRRRH